MFLAKPPFMFPSLCLSTCTMHIIVIVIYTAQQYYNPKDNFAIELVVNQLLRVTRKITMTMATIKANTLTMTVQPL